MTVGFIGLGNIGAPMARRLIGYPEGLTVYDVVDKATEPFAAEGATVTSSPAELAKDASVICIVVQNEQQVRDVLDGPDGILSTARPGTVVAVHSTISAEGAVALAELAAASGVDLIDAPISGGGMGAHDGTLAVMLGGTEEAVEKARPVLESFGSLVVRMGPVGAGTQTKIARNLITFASFAVVGEAQRIADAAGLDLSLLGDIVRHSDKVTAGPGAIMLRGAVGHMADDDPWRSIFEHTATLGTKDLELAQQLGAELGVDTPFAELAAANLRIALGLDPE